MVLSINLGSLGAQTFVLSIVSTAAGCDLYKPVHFYGRMIDPTKALKLIRVSVIIYNTTIMIWWATLGIYGDKLLFRKYEMLSCLFLAAVAAFISMPSIAFFGLRLIRSFSPVIASLNTSDKENLSMEINRPSKIRNDIESLAGKWSMMEPENDNKNLAQSNQAEITNAEKLVIKVEESTKRAQILKVLRWTIYMSIYCFYLGIVIYLVCIVVINHVFELQEHVLYGFKVYTDIYIFISSHYYMVNLYVKAFQSA